MVILLLTVSKVHATIDGLTGTSFNLVAKQGYISTSDGDSFLMWGYANGDASPMQYPGPTLILNQGATVTVTLKNMLPPATGQNVSIVFPGLNVTATGGSAGLVTPGAPPDGTTTVTYTFTATDAGTYLYHSGTNMELQVEMGLVGAIIVRSARAAEQEHPEIPNHPLTNYAYDVAPAAKATVAYQREYLFLLTEMDPRVHREVELGNLSPFATGSFADKNWFMNGRNFPDNMSDANVPWLPTQPYNCTPMMHPGEKLLARVIGAGRTVHPFHFHGNDVTVIARDGRLLSTDPSATGPGADLAYQDYTVNSIPGQTFDAIFHWTGEKLGFDMYGHANAGDPLQPYEYAQDHAKPFPMNLPPISVLNLGQFWSGSPFLGGAGELPPGFVGLNTGGGYFFMWHSHSEKELTSNDIFPGGMLTMMVVLPWNVAIP